jgi:tRNA(Ile)-lysidine synthase
LSDSLLNRLSISLHDAGVDPELNALLVALSGGPDSTALLHLLTRWRENYPGLRLYAAHFNHQLRAEADSEQRFVTELCARLSVELYTGTGDIVSAATSAGVSIHVAARKLRYKFLAETSRRLASESGHLPFILTGHHADDQVETILMRLFAGSGVEGLAGIKSVTGCPGARDIKLIRPLLEIGHQELVEYCSANHLAFTRDQSNLDTAYPRAKLRADVIPVITRSFGDSARSGIGRTGKMLAMSAEFIDREISRAMEDCTVSASSDEIILDYNKFRSYFCLIRLALIQRSSRLLAGDDFRLPLERAESADSGLLGGSGEYQLGSGVGIWKFKSMLYIAYKSKTWPPIHISLDREIDLQGWGKLKFSIIDASQAVIPPTAGTLYLNADNIAIGEVTVRPAQPGDRMRPLGSNYLCRVTDLLRDEAVPPHRRLSPVLVSGDKIIALLSWRIDHNSRLTTNSRQALKVTLEPAS